jgi:hypothetical protein
MVAEGTTVLVLTTYDADYAVLDLLSPGADSHQVLIYAARGHRIVVLWAAGLDRGGRCADLDRELQP